MDTIKFNDRKRLAELLRPLAGNLSFSCGQPACWSEGSVVVSVDRVWDGDGRLEHLVTVFAGYPPPGEVSGLGWEVREAASRQVVRAGQTDSRGQLRLRGLEPGEYRLRVGGPMAFVFPVPSGLVALAAAEGSSSFEFHSADGTIEARILERAGLMVLEATIRAEIVTDPMARYRVWNGENRELARGYLGLYDVGDGTWFGAATLDTELSRHWSPDCDVEVDPFNGHDLTRDDRADLERSISATEHELCREALQGVLDRLPLEKDRLP